MTDELSGAADIVTGGAIARAFESDAGENTHAYEGNCLNCGALLHGNHCHTCGQKGHIHRTLSAFGHDFLHSVLHFDGKIWRTLPMLFWRPGDLTRRYIHGERAKFVSPLALFLFTVFLTFAMFNWLAPKSSVIFGNEQAEEQYQADRKDKLDAIAELVAGKKETDAAKQPGRQWRDGEIARQKVDLKTFEESHNIEIRQAALAKSQIREAKTDNEANIARLEKELKSAREGGKPTKAIEDNLESERVELTIMNGANTALQQDSRLDIDGDWTFTDSNLPGGKALNTLAKQAMKNPQLLIYKIQSNAYKYSWALIPLSVPFVWLLFFWQRRFKMFDHAVFVTYSLSFMMFLITVCAILIQFPATKVIGGLTLCFIPPIHMYRQLYQAYETSRVAAFIRMCALTVFAVTALGLFIMLIITLGVAG
jgi:Protein of unknown function (DUF3667)